MYYTTLHEVLGININYLDQKKSMKKGGGGTEPTKCMWSMNEWKNKKQIKTTKCKGLPNDAQNLTKKHEESKEDRKGTALKEGGKGNEICNQ